MDSGGGPSSLVFVAQLLKEACRHRTRRELATSVSLLCCHTSNLARTPTLKKPPSRPNRDRQRASAQFVLRSATVESNGGSGSCSAIALTERKRQSKSYHPKRAAHSTVAREGHRRSEQKRHARDRDGRPTITNDGAPHEVATRRGVRSLDIICSPQLTKLFDAFIQVQGPGVVLYV